MSVYVWVGTYITIAEFFIILPHGPNCCMGEGAFSDLVLLKQAMYNINFYFLKVIKGDLFDTHCIHDRDHSLKENKVKSIKFTPTLSCLKNYFKNNFSIKKNRNTVKNLYK